jgi:hypothetical protein
MKISSFPNGWDVQQRSSRGDSERRKMMKQDSGELNDEQNRTNSDKLQNGIGDACVGVEGRCTFNKTSLSQLLRKAGRGRC